MLVTQKFPQRPTTSTYVLRLSIIESNLPHIMAAQGYKNVSSCDANCNEDRKVQ